MSDQPVCFLAPSGEAWFRLSADGQLIPVEHPPAITPGGSLPPVLVVPGARGVPFRVPLPFADPEKVGLVLPGLLAEVFARYKPDWLLSYRLQPAPPLTPALSPRGGEKGEEDTASSASLAPHGGERVGVRGWEAVGLAFPPEAGLGPEILSERWRLVIPDLWLVPECPPPGRVQICSPAGEIGLETSEGGRWERILIAGRLVSPPSGASADDPVTRIDLLESTTGVGKTLSALLEQAGTMDLSRWAEKRRATVLATVGRVAVGVLLALGVVFHLLLYREVVLRQEGNRRIRQEMKQAFEAAFPGKRGVEPLAQARQAADDLRRRKEGLASLPTVPGWAWIGELSAALPGIATLTALQARPAGWSIRGTTLTHGLAQQVVTRLSTGARVRDVRLRDSRSLEGASSDAGVTFEVEGGWR